VSAREDKAPAERRRHHQELSERLASLSLSDRARERELLKRVSRLDEDLELEAGLTTCACDELYVLPRLSEDERHRIYERCEPWCPTRVARSAPSAELLAWQAHFVRRQRARQPHDPRFDGYLPLKETLAVLDRTPCPDCGATGMAYVHPDASDAVIYYECEPSCPNR
jgi:hypothetical protein